MADPYLPDRAPSALTAKLAAALAFLGAALHVPLALVASSGIPDEEFRPSILAWLLIVAAALLTGGILLWLRKAAGRFILGGAAGAYAIHLLATRHMLATEDIEAFLVTLGLFVIPAATTAVLALVPSTARWTRHRATTTS